jgi:hypothetical protein
LCCGGTRCSVDTNHYDWGILCFPSVPPSNFWGSVSIRSHSSLSNSSFVTCLSLCGLRYWQHRESLNRDPYPSDLLQADV